MRFIAKPAAGHTETGWVVWDNYFSEWVTAYARKKEAMDQAEDWNLAEELAVKNRRTSFVCIQGGLAPQ